jgi:predicted TPR repeat methyltransferase
MLSYLPKTAAILELGSAHGRDADYIESLGYKIYRTDAVKAFVDYLQAKNHDASVLNAIDGKYPKNQDAIYANAVFLHFTIQELHKVMDNIRTSFVDDGILGFSVKIGEGDKWTKSKIDSPRYFQYWKENELRAFLKEHHFDVIFFETGTTGHDNSDWYHVIARSV